MKRRVRNKKSRMAVMMKRARSKMAVTRKRARNRNQVGLIKMMARMQSLISLISLIRGRVEAEAGTGRRTRQGTRRKDQIGGVEKGITEKGTREGEKEAGAEAPADE